MCTNIENSFTRFDNRLMTFLYTSDLTITEYKVILFIIRQTSGFHRENKKLSAVFIAKGTNITPRSVQRAIAKLNDRGVIEITSKNGAPNVLGLAAAYDHTVAGNEQTYDQAVVGGTTVQSQVPTTELSYKERNRERNIKEREGTPTLDDVISYCQQMSFTFSPERFFNYYEALGWQKNGQPIMNWKAVARNWQARERVQPAQEEVEKDDWGRPIPPKYV